MRREVLNPLRHRVHGRDDILALDCLFATLQLHGLLERVPVEMHMGQLIERDRGVASVDGFRGVAEAIAPDKPLWELDPHRLAHGERLGEFPVVVRVETGSDSELVLEMEQALQP